MKGEAWRTGPSPVDRGRSGFGLPEVVVALVVLEVGVLGLAGLLALSGRILARGVLVERAVYAAEGVADSLSAAGPAAAGARAFPGGRVRWTIPGTLAGLRRVRVRAVDDAGRLLLSFEELAASGAVPGTPP